MLSLLFYRMIKAAIVAENKFHIPLTRVTIFSAMLVAFLTQ
jgi:hypothetical protein